MDKSEVIAVVFIFVCLGLLGMLVVKSFAIEKEKTQAIAEMVKQGANPLEAACAIRRK